MKRITKLHIIPIILIGICSLFWNGCEEDEDNENLQETVTDIDGNEYIIVNIGNQIWMAENLKVTHYRNGDPITNITDNSVWNNLETEAFCNYNNSEQFSNNFGRLYNWHAVSDNRNICPDGWHIPTDAEWDTLVIFLGGESIAGGMLKTKNYWFEPNIGATDEFGFSALPSGIRAGDGKFMEMYTKCSWWSSSEILGIGAWVRNLSYDNEEVYRGTWYKFYGASIRCIKD